MKYGCLGLSDKKIGNLLVLRPPFGVAHDAGFQIYSQYCSKGRCRSASYPWWLHFANAIENQREEVNKDIAATDHRNAARVEVELVGPDDQSGAEVDEIIQDDVAPTDHEAAAQVNETVAEKLAVPDDLTGAPTHDHQAAAQVNETVSVVPDDQTGAQVEKINQDISATDLAAAQGDVTVAEVVDAQNHVANVTHVGNAGRVRSDSSTSLATKMKAIKKTLPKFSRMREMITDRQELASGTYGRVYIVTTKMGTIAVKTLKTEKMTTLTPGQVDMCKIQLYEEAQLLFSLRHPNILTFYMMITKFDNGFPGMATELMSDNSLYDCLLKGDRRVRCWSGRLNVAQQVVEAMLYLHQRCIVHFDLKSCNILVKYDCSKPDYPICKLGDFGSAMVHKREPHDNGRIPITYDRGTLIYMAPEVIQARRRPNQITFVTEKVDVFSFGMLMWELVAGDLPYRGMSNEQVEFGVVEESMRPEVPVHCNRVWLGLMRDCWAQDENHRPTFYQIRYRLKDLILQYNRDTSMNRTRGPDYSSS